MNICFDCYSYKDGLKGDLFRKINFLGTLHKWLVIIIINFSCFFLRGASGIFRACPKVASECANRPSPLDIAFSLIPCQAHVSKLARGVPCVVFILHRTPCSFCGGWQHTVQGSLQYILIYICMTSGEALEE